MSCLCDTIARSLALVTIATGAAFVDWSFRPITSSLDAPKPIAVSQPQPDAAQSPVGTSTAEKASASGEAATGEAAGGAGTEGTQDTNGAGGAGGDSHADTPAQVAFDPNTLGTKITTADTYKLWQSGDVIFIDARPEHEYLDGHIPYSFLVPPESLDKGRLGALMEATGLSPADRVVIYCEGGSCNASELVGLTLQDMGFGTIHIDVDGYPGWVKAGYEVETGPDPVLGELP